MQSWAGYRRIAAVVHTYPIPTKSGVAGLLGACLGVQNYMSLVREFGLRVRVDRTNPAKVDLQIGSGPKAHEIDDAARALVMATATIDRRTPFPKKLHGGTLAGAAMVDRYFIPHAEFICEITGDSKRVEAWHAAFRDPAFMPYLGRMAYAPTWPLVLGTYAGPEDVLSALPRVRRHDEPNGTDSDPAPKKAVRVYQVDGNYPTHEPGVPTQVNPPAVNTRREQLQWVSQHTSL